MSPLFFFGEGMTLGLDPLFILGSRQRGGPFVVHHPPHPRGFWGDRDCLEGDTSQFFGGVPPYPALGNDGFSSWHGGGTQRGRSGDTPTGGGGDYEPCGRDISGGTPMWAPPDRGALLEGGRSLTAFWGGCSSWILISGQGGSGGRRPGGKGGVHEHPEGAPHPHGSPTQGCWATWGGPGGVIRPGGVTEGVAVAPRGRAALLRVQGGSDGCCPPRVPPRPLPDPPYPSRLSGLLRGAAEAAGAGGGAGEIRRLRLLGPARDSPQGQGQSPRPQQGWHRASWPPPWPAAMLGWPRDTLSPHHPGQDTGSSCHPRPGMSHPRGATLSQPIPCHPWEVPALRSPVPTPSHPWEVPAPCSPVPRPLVIMPACGQATQVPPHSPLPPRPWDTQTLCHSAPG